MYFCVSCACLALTEATREVGFHKVEVEDWAAMWYWEQNPGPLEEQQGI